MFDILNLFEELDSVIESNENIELSSQDKQELQQMINAVNEYVTVSPNWQTADAKHLKFVGEIDTRDIDIEDHFEWDEWDECYIFQEDRVIDQYKESLYDEEFYWIAETLGITKQDYEAAIEAQQPMQIPNSQWKLDADIEIAIVDDEPVLRQLANDRGDYWNPPNHDVDLDKEEIKLQATYYFVR